MLSSQNNRLIVASVSVALFQGFTTKIDVVPKPCKSSVKMAGVQVVIQTGLKSQASLPK
jgi:hypothetical protein